MRRGLRVTALALALAVALGSIALAASLKKGATYTGTITSSPVPLTLKVSSSGKTVKLAMANPPQHCESNGSAGTKQITSPAKIAANGSFHAKISYEFPFTHKIVATLSFSGKFSGKKVSGKATSQFTFVKGCDGTSSFAAKAK